MAELSQAGRPLRVTTPLGPDALVIRKLTGREAVSTPFLYTLDLLSTDASVDAADMLRGSVTVTIETGAGDIRHINGVVRRFVQRGQQEGLTFYQAEIVPKLWFLTLERDCRIFQQKTALEIVEQVLRDHDVSDYSIRTTASVPQREYCVQYRETDYDFVARLLEDEGIYYWFEHGDDSHTLVLSDRPSVAPQCDEGHVARVAVDPSIVDDVITEIDAEHAVYVGKVTLRDYSSLDPPNTLEAVSSGDGRGEIYDYPGRYEVLDAGERYARIRLEAEEAMRHAVRGAGTCRYLESGYRFGLQGHYRGDANRTYFLLEVRHDAGAGDYRSWQDGDYDYRNEFLAIPDDVAYRPPARTPRPVVRGSQTAVVVGRSGEEIEVDKYGRVKVQFFWDREGRKDENSSCWVRVASTWAGKGWGHIQIPRIGQEVIIDFLEGDPDRPIITGRVYNAEQMPPYALPDNQTQSGVKSRSSKNGGTDNFNEIRFEDKKGSEQIYIHAEKNKVVVVENDRTERVGHDETIKIGNDRTEEVGNDETIQIGNDRTEQVGGNETIKIAGNRKESVAGKEEISIGGDRKETVGGKEDIKVAGDRKTMIGGKDELVVGGDRKETVGGKLDVTAGQSIKIMAAVSIELKVGGSSIKIGPAGITIKAPQVKVTGSAQVQVKGAMLKLQGDAMLQAKAPMTMLNGDGMLKMQGGITMIN